jgi:hypothetical protein
MWPHTIQVCEKVPDKELRSRHEVDLTPISFPLKMMKLTTLHFKRSFRKSVKLCYTITTGRRPSTITARVLQGILDGNPEAIKMSPSPALCTIAN